MQKKFGIGMYTVHQSVRRDMYGTFRGLAEMGYRGIEFYGELDFDLKEIERSLRDSGLTLTSWHVEWRNLQPDRFGQTVNYLQAAGCPAAVIPCLGGKWNVAHGPQEECREIWLRYIEEMNRICERLNAEGIRTGYHNHEHEFKLVYEGKSVFDMLFEGLSPEVIMEFDSGNCIEGGTDPLTVLRKYRDREILLHLKPFSRTRGFDTVLGAEDDENDWEHILASHDFLWLLVESENAQLPEMENAKRCLQGIKNICQ
ncbi:MAG TPA: sugar phosphate isomerase/epimerase [Candidatus Limivivens intestinipullorum]|uniref:Sugar phosphate isomerase/epimerase n=1 Tax=Candidatus Limivivens intestinipullorum TaxID=2840858 RepID=A0A9D1ES27_9FIRM|nr:sugar phosphate isomerase/epimerase [Candidatus Limivivens intestinipullorum]